VPDFPDWFDPAKDRMLTPSTVKGLLHPIRLRLFDMLQADGPATATTLGRRMGQSTALVSYHLRVLADHGFIVEDTERGDRRDRWWRAAYRSAVFTFRAEEDPGTPETIEDSTHFMQLVADESHRKVVAFIATLSAYRGDLAELPWTVGDRALDLTTDEITSLRREMGELVARYRRRSAHPPAGTQRVHAAYQIVPDDE
jgi:DNA-binding transcriptional ArsR family regulator